MQLPIPRDSSTQHAPLSNGSQQSQADGLSSWEKVQTGASLQLPTSSGLSAPSGPLKVTPQEDMLPDHLSKESAALLESQLILEVQAEPQSKPPWSV